MEHLDSRETLPERSHRASRKHGDPILPPFAVPDKNLSVAEIHVPDPESNTLHQSQTGPAREIARAPFLVLKTAEQGFCFFPGRDDRESFRLPCPKDVSKLSRILVKDYLAEKNQRARGPVPRGGSRVPVGGETGREAVGFRTSRSQGVAFVAEQDISPDPLNAGFFRPYAVVAESDGGARSIEKLGLLPIRIDARRRAHGVDLPFRRRKGWTLSVIGSVSFQEKRLASRRNAMPEALPPPLACTGAGSLS